MEASMPLTQVKAGNKVRLVTVDAMCGLEGRLAAMGMVPGEIIEVLRNSCHGPFIISIKGSRVLLGHGMARKIFVE